MKYSGPLPVIDVVQAAGRFDRSPELLKAAVRSYIKQTTATLHIGTEAATERREKALREVARETDWGIVTGDRSYRDDSYIMWDTKRWRCLHRSTRPVRTGTLFTGKGNRMPKNAAAVVVLAHRQSGHRLVVVAGHPPSGVERGGIIQRSLRGLAWRTEVVAQRRLANRLARHWRADGVIIANDWNAGAKKATNRAVLGTIMPRWKCAVRKPYPKAGTHGGRWIDFVMFRRALRLRRPAWLMPDDAASDHRPTRTRLQFTKRPRNRTGVR